MQTVPANTIVINERVLHGSNYAAPIFHECVHYELHFLFYRLQQMYHDNDVSRVRTKKLIVKNGKVPKDPLKWKEWQAQRGAYALMMHLYGSRMICIPSPKAMRIYFKKPRQCMKGIQINHCGVSQIDYFTRRILTFSIPLLKADMVSILHLLLMVRLRKKNFGLPHCMSYGLNTLSETLETIRGTAGDQTAESISAVTDWVNGMGAEGMEQLQSLYSLIIQMQGAGMENAEIANALGLSEEELTGVLTTLQSIKEIANGTDSLSGLSDLFGEMDANAGEVLTHTLDVNSDEAAAQIDGFIEGYADRSVNVKVVLDSLTSDAITAWEAANGTVSLTGPMASVELTLGDNAASDIKNAWENDKLAVYGANGLPLEITPEVLTQITANDVCAYDADGTLHVIITPEVGTAEYVEFANNTAGQEQTGLFGVDIGSTTDQVNKLLGLVDEYNNAMDESSATRERSANTDDFMTKDIENQNAIAWLESSGNYADQIDTVVNSLTDADIDNISQQIMALYAALSSGDLDVNTAAEYQAQLESLLSVVDLIDTNSSGSAISEGIAEGMVKYGWSGDASTLATGIHTAVDSALQINSPSRLMKPSGSYVAQGIGEGMKTYSFAGDVSNMAASLQSAVSTSLNAGTLQSVGTNAMRGLVNGINAGKASVIGAMRNAAKAALQAAKNELGIRSPSRVFRDEVGTMIMRGLGEGVSTEARAQAKLIQNASQFLTNEAMNGVSGYTADNRRTYNQQSSVTLNFDGLSVRSDSDVRSLAIEIAALTKRNNALHGA